MADYATLVYDIDSSQARGAAKALGELNSATITVANGFAKFEKTLRGADGKFRSTSKYVLEHRGEIEGLAMAYNPVLAAQIKYRDEAVRTATAVKAGVITEQQRVDILQRTRVALDAAAAAATKFGASNQVASHHASNLSFQLNDIGMMMATGQNPFTLMMQQGPQVAQIFSQMNAEGRKIGPTLVGAFKMFLNPTTAVTLALIGGAAALFQWGKSALSASSDSKKFSDTLSDLEASLSGISNFSNFDYETRRMNVSLSEIVSKYGEMNKGVETHIQLLNDAAIASANLSKMNFMSLFTETFDTGWLTTRVDEVRIAFETTNDAARTLIDLMGRAEKAKGLTAQREAAEQLRDYVIKITGGYQNMTAEQLKFAMELNRVIDSQRQMEIAVARTGDNVADSARETANWERNMAAVKAQIDAISRSLNAIAGFQIATVSAQLEERLLATGVAAGEAARQVQAFETAAGFVERRKALIAQYAGNYQDPGYKTQIRMLAEEEAAARKAADAQYSLGQTRERLAEEERERRKKGSAGGGAAKAAERRAEAELRATQKGFQSLRELMEQDSLYQVAEWEKRQAQLELALQKRLITTEQYLTLESQLRQMYFGSEYERQQLQYDMDLEQLKAHLEARRITQEQYNAQATALMWGRINQEADLNNSRWSAELNGLATHMGQLNELAGGGYDKLLKAQKVFGAASALISTYQGAAKALELPFPYNMAAMAKVLAAGMGLVNAIKSGGKAGGKGGSASSGIAAKQEPTRNVLIRLEGSDFMVDLAESMLEQIYEQSRDGRVIIARDF